MPAASLQLLCFSAVLTATGEGFGGGVNAMTFQPRHVHMDLGLYE